VVAGYASNYTHYHVDAQGRRTQRKLVGVTTLMAERLVQYVHTDKKKGKKAAATKSTNRLSKPSKTLGGVKIKQERTLSRTATRAAVLNGAQLGSLVHQQMADLIDMDNAGFARKYGVRDEGAGGGGLHVNTECLMKAIIEQGMVPVRPEFLVYNLAAGHATRIDNVAIELATGRLVFIEYKTGYGEGKFMEPARHLRWRHPAMAASGTPCSPYSMACTQITLGTAMAVQQMHLPPEAYRLQVMHVDLDAKTQIVRHVHTAKMTPEGYIYWDQTIRAALAT